jgi:hypothetical protein
MVDHEILSDLMYDAVEHPFASAAATYQRHGIATIPVGGENGKKPLLRNWQKWRGPMNLDVLRELVSKFADSNIAALPGSCCTPLVVVDIDDPKLASKMFDRFGATPLVTETPSGGLHLWYCGRIRKTTLRHAEKLPVDIQGAGSVIVVPPSIRPSGEYAGKRYRFIQGTLADLHDLPPLAPGSLPAHGYTAWMEGQRNDGLFNALRAIAHDFPPEDFAGFVVEAQTISDSYLPPLPDDEVIRTARSVWNDRLMHPKRRGYKEGHMLLNVADAMSLPGNALKLYCALHAAHDATDRDFALSLRAMWEKSVIPGWGLHTYTKARDDLLALGKIQCIKAAHRGQPALYRLTSSDQ